jgi:hypothetical protein
MLKRLRKLFQKKPSEPLGPDRMNRLFNLEQHYFWEMMCSVMEPDKMEVYKQKHRKYQELLWIEYDKIYKKYGYGRFEV